MRPILLPSFVAFGLTLAATLPAAAASLFQFTATGNVTGANAVVPGLSAGDAASLSFVYDADAPDLFDFTSVEGSYDAVVGSVVAVFGPETVTSTTSDIRVTNFLTDQFTFLTMCQVRHRQATLRIYRSNQN